MLVWETGGASGMTKGISLNLKLRPSGVISLTFHFEGEHGEVLKNDKSGRRGFLPSLGRS
jgi:hypothetical protein